MGSGYKSFTAGAVLTASDVNNYLMEQGVMYFATTTARDTAITAPEDGMVCYIGSNDSSEGLYTYNGTSWRKGPGWNAPWGYIGGSAVTASTSKTNADITTYSLSAIARRRYRITAGAASVSVNAAPTIVGLAIYAAGTKIAGCNAYCPDINNGYMGATTVGYYAPTSTGTVTIAAYGELVLGSATITWGASSTSPIQLYVEDIGPSGAPA